MDSHCREGVRRSEEEIEAKRRIDCGRRSEQRQTATVTGRVQPPHNPHSHCPAARRATRSCCVCVVLPVVKVRHIPKSHKRNVCGKKRLLRRSNALKWSLPGRVRGASASSINPNLNPTTMTLFFFLLPSQRSCSSTLEQLFSRIPNDLCGMASLLLFLSLSFFF